MKIEKSILSVLILFGVTVAPLLAHHSVSQEFDETKATTIQGVLTRVEWTNPHVLVYVDVRDASGRVTNWGIEIAPPNALTRAGVPQGTFEFAKSYSFEVWPARNGSSKANGRKMTFADGKTIGFGDQLEWIPQSTPGR